MKKIKEKNLRPSLLPKLAACPRYRSEKDAGPAAERGTEMDDHFRAIVAADNPEQAVAKAAAALDDEAADAVAWAIDLAYVLSGGHRLEAREEHLRIECCGMTGTADLLCEGGKWSADLKSGQIRNYKEQQAAYALGFMDKFFEDEWTVYLIYCDQREHVRLEYTREEAKSIVYEQIARYYDPELAPTPCDYCGWCANQFRCVPRIEQAMPLVAIDDDDPERAFEIILADNNKLAAFLKACKTVKDMEQKARDTAKARLVEGKKDGLKIKGVSLVTKKGSQVLPAEALAPIAEKVGTKELLSSLGSVTKKKAEKLFAEADIELPADALIETAGTCYVQVR